MTQPADYAIGQIADLLSGAKAFTGMPRTLALQIAEMMTMRHFSKGEAITLERTENQGQLMLLVSGEAEVAANANSKSNKKNLPMCRAGPQRTGRHAPDKPICCSPAHGRNAAPHCAAHTPRQYHHPRAELGK